MKKKPLTTYPSIPAPKVDQFTLPQLTVQLLRNKQFVKGIQNLFSNCIITKTTPQPLLLPNLSSYTSKSKSINSPTSATSSSNRNQKMSASLHNVSQNLLISEQSQQEQCEFIFQRQTKNKMMYPWAIGDNGREEVVECNIITDEITDFIEQAIEIGLHKILNKEFINVTNEILAMREEINIFTKEQLERTDSIKTQFQRELQKMQKKLQQQQHISTSILNQPLERFSRNKGLLNSSLSNNSTKDSNKYEQIEDGKGVSIHHEVFTLKKQIQALKKSVSINSQSNKSVSSDIIKMLEQKVFTTQEKLSQLNLSVKLVLQEQKQKCRKGYEQLCSQIASTTSKQFLSQEVKKSVKSNLKIYLDQIMKCKKDIQDLYQRIDRNDKGMQQYLGNQLKNVWTLVSGIKTRVQNIQEQFNVGMDQSFVL